MQLGQSFWNQRYIDKNTGWDLGEPSPPLVAIFDKIKDKNAAILIPGCGNAYEAEYLALKGFSNITLLDIAPNLVAQLQEKFKKREEIQVVCHNFFEHQGQYDFIIEQTFFCALDPKLREQYVKKMHSLLKPKGILTGVIFNREFEKEGPPFGGKVEEYNDLFSAFFDATFENSVHSVAGRIEIIFQAKKFVSNK